VNKTAMQHEKLVEKLIAHASAMFAVASDRFMRIIELQDENHRLRAELAELKCRRGKRS
jgi:hypothetical protein